MNKNRLDVNASMARPGGPPVHVTSPQNTAPQFNAGAIASAIGNGRRPNTVDPFGAIARIFKSAARKAGS